VINGVAFTREGKLVPKPTGYEHKPDAALSGVRRQRPNVRPPFERTRDPQIPLTRHYVKGLPGRVTTSSTQQTLPFQPLDFPYFRLHPLPGLHLKSGEHYPMPQFPRSALPPPLCHHPPRRPQAAATEVCDASLKITPHDASQNLGNPSQLTGTEGVRTRPKKQRPSAHLRHTGRPVLGDFLPSGASPGAGPTPAALTLTLQSSYTCQ